MSDQGERVMRWTEMSDEAADRTQEAGRAEGEQAEEFPVRMTFPEAKMPDVGEPPHDVWGKVESPAAEAEVEEEGPETAPLPETTDETEVEADDVKVAPVPAEAAAPEPLRAPEVAEPAEAPEIAEPPAPGGQQAWEGELFDGQGGGEGDDLYAPVTPTGPSTPPKPGRPSSGNWQMPDWMQDEDSADAMLGKGSSGKRSRFGRSRSDDDMDESPAPTPAPAPAPAAPQPRAESPVEPQPSAQPVPPAPVQPSPHYDGGDDEGGRAKLMLYGGVGLLVVAMVAAGGVYFMKNRDSSGPAASEGKPGRPAGNKPPAQDVPKVQLPPDKQLQRFAGRPSRMLGRVTDVHSGLSYPRLAAPWIVPTKKNKLGVTGWSGQQIVVTEKRAGQMWYGQLLTGTLIPTLQASYKGPESVKQVAALASLGFEQNYYAFPHRKTPLASQPLTIDGHKGWLIASYLNYKRAGVRATGEVVVAAVIDTGRRSPAVVFASMPNTHRKMWPDLNQFLGQLKVAS